MRLQELRTKYRDAIIGLAAKYHAGDVRIFGSVARGEAGRQSDVDILVRFKPGASLLDEAGLDYELKQLLGPKVDVIGDDTLRDELAPFILQDAVQL